MSKKQILMGVLLVLLLSGSQALALSGPDLSWWTADSGGGDSSIGDAANGKVFSVVCDGKSLPRHITCGCQHGEKLGSKRGDQTLAQTFRWWRITSV